MRLPLYVALLVVFALLAPATRAATGWSEPVVVFQTDGYTSEPVLITDPSQMVHLFFMASQQRSPQVGGSGSLMYARLEGRGWSKPRDVLVTPGGGPLQQPMAALDSRGFLHVIWKGGPLSRLYYSRAHVTTAGSATGWTPPQELSAGGVAPGSFGRPADIAVSPDDVVHVVFSTRDGILRARRSADGGDSWTSPTTIADNVGSGQGIDNPRILANGPARLIVTWTQVKLPTAWPNLGLYTSTSLDGGSSWSRQARIAGADYSLVSTIANGVNPLFRTWHSVASRGETRYQWSTDGGQTWTPSQLVSPSLRSGLSGYSGTVFDSAGILHFVEAGSRPGRDPEGMYYLQSDGKKWSDPIYISKGTIGRQSVESPALAISRGNQLHVVYEDDFQRIWYTSKLADAPAIPAQPVPVPVSQVPAPVRPVNSVSAPEPTSTPVIATEPTVTADQVLARPADSPAAGPAVSPGVPLVAGAGASVVLLAALVLARRLIAARD